MKANSFKKASPPVKPVIQTLADIELSVKRTLNRKAKKERLRLQAEKDAAERAAAKQLEEQLKNT